MSEPMVQPSACGRCGVPLLEHMQRWKKSESGDGWHQWIAPSQAQILARMKARRLAVTVARVGALPMPVGNAESARPDGITRLIAPTQALRYADEFRYRDAATGMGHDHVRYPAGTAPTPFGCRWCGTEHDGHGGRYMRGKGMHHWEQPTQAQIKARMLARRNTRKAVCRCPLDDDAWRPLAPVVDPYQCEADDCHGYTSESNPFGARSIHERSAEVSRKCGQCAYRTSVWHVDDGSAEEELHRHVARVHGGPEDSDDRGCIDDVMSATEQAEYDRDTEYQLDAEDDARWAADGDR
ncbi:hypothetical protein ACFYRN_45600 [Streptomyces sp. NPDC005227]|uniref:hypothetical protein n=1 Tax=Streptomyces sp. NPDC005227 TaxID=3364707 RepID=UPI0036818F0C